MSAIKGRIWARARHEMTYRGRRIVVVETEGASAERWPSTVDGPTEVYVVGDDGLEMWAGYLTAETLASIDRTAERAS